MTYVVTLADGSFREIRADNAESARHQFGPITARGILKVEPKRINGRLPLDLSHWFGPIWEEGSLWSE